MLKYLYKTLLISILSCSLMVLDFNSSGIGFQSAQAETLKTEKVSDSNLMATLTMTAVGLLASRLYKCKLTTDMMVAAAGGAAYIGGDILAFFKLKSAMKGLEMEIIRDSKGNINEEQVKQLERLKKSYEEAKKTANTKKMLQTAAAAAFAAAAVLAYTQEAKALALTKTCQGALMAASTACATNPYTAADAPIMKLAVTQEEATEQSSKAPMPSSGAQAKNATEIATVKATEASAVVCPASKGATLTCANGTAAKLLDKGFCPLPPVLDAANIQTFNKQLYANAYSPLVKESTLASLFRNVILSDAHASLFSPLGIASSAAITFLLMTSKTLGAQIDLFLFSPMNRAIVWGVLAGLVYMSTSATNKVISQMDENIKKIDDILNAYKSMANGTTATQVAVTNPTNTSTGKPQAFMEVGATDYEAVDLGANGGGTTPCFTGADSAKCKSFEDVAKDLPSFQNLNAESQKQISGILKAGDGFNGKSTISAAALSNAAQLAGTANALNSAAANAKKKLLDQLKAGNSKINPDAISKKFSDDMEKAVKAALKKSNSSAADMMASMYGGSAGSFGTGSGSDSKNALANKEDANAAAKKGAPAVANVVDISAPASSESGLTVGDGSKGSTGLNGTEMAKAGDTATGLEGFELKNNDITTDAGSSLFDLISNRYQQSGYPRLFKKDVQEAAPVKK